MMVFAVVMFGAAYFMLKPGKPMACQKEPNLHLISAEGFVVGAVTGFVGVGGGFLIVPALVLLAGLTMQQAVATSLVIITAKSVAGFAKYIEIVGDLNPQHRLWRHRFLCCRGHRRQPCRWTHCLSTAARQTENRFRGLPRCDGFLHPDSVGTWPDHLKPDAPG